MAYPFHDVFYVNNGMGSLFDDLLKDIELKKKESILKVFKEDKAYRIISNKDEYLSKKVILNSYIYESSQFYDKKIKKYYDSFSFSDKSAFVINLTLNFKKDFLHHYQIILDKKIPNSVPNAFLYLLVQKMITNYLKMDIVLPYQLIQNLCFGRNYLKKSMKNKNKLHKNL